MTSIMYTDNDKIPIMRQPEQPEFFDLSTIDQQPAKKSSQNSQVITLEPMDIKLSVKLYCCACPEDDCCNKKKSESDKCESCDKSNECECCLCSKPMCNMDRLCNIFYFKKSNNVQVKEENIATSP